MLSLHSVNIAIHVVAGTIALVMGFLTLLTYLQPGRHVRYGRIFLRLLGVVVATGMLGLLFFRNDAFLFLLTLLSGYVGYAGYRNIRLRERRSTVGDSRVAIGAWVAGFFYLFWLKQAGVHWAPSVVYATLGALALVTSYDLLKYYWLHERIKSWWRYEHIYKMISAYSAILSAFVGTLLPNCKPYSQVGPSGLGLVVIVFLIWQQSREQRKTIRTQIGAGQVLTGAGQ